MPIQLRVSFFLVWELTDPRIRRSPFSFESTGKLWSIPPYYVPSPPFRTLADGALFVPPPLKGLTTVCFVPAPPARREKVFPHLELAVALRILSRSFSSTVHWRRADCRLSLNTSTSLPRVIAIRSNVCLWTTFRAPETRAFRHFLSNRPFLLGARPLRVSGPCPQNSSLVHAPAPRQKVLSTYPPL